MIRKINSGGFTLIEMALVLVLGGMLMTVVLKGQTMIESAKLLRVVNDLQSISVAYNTYSAMYNALPGDDGNSHGWMNVDRGNNNGLIEGQSAIDGSEAHEAWQALRQSGLLIGNPDATSENQLFKNPYGGHYRFSFRNFGPRSGMKNCIVVDGLAGRMAESIDIKYDDGLFNSGSVTADTAYTDQTVELYYAM